MSMEAVKDMVGYSHYSAYKTIGARWFETIPKDWSVARVKRLLVANDAGIWGELGGDMDTMVLRSTEQTVDGEWTVTEPAYVRLSEADRRFYRLVEGDLVVTKSSGSEKHIGKTSYVDSSIAILNAAYSNFNQRLRTDRSLLNPRFLFYILNNSLGRDQLVYHSSTTTGLANLNGTILGEIMIALPPLPEQTRIAAFLDRKCRQIDAAIAQKERLIALLKERRQVLVQQAVTKGLDPQVKMKDSGVADLGEIPQHWDVRRLQRLAEIESSGIWGFDHPTATSIQKPIPTTAQLSMDGEWDYADMANRNIPTKDWERYKCLTGDTVVVKASGSAANIITGKCGYIDEKDSEQFAFGNFLLRVRPQGYHPKLLYYLLRSNLTKQRIEVMVSSTTYPNLKVDEYVKALLPVPPPDEQTLIACFLDRECGKIGRAVVKQEGVIAKLKEYRSILINAAVTGKIKVPEE